MSTFPFLGLLIYNEVGLFFDEKNVPASLKQSITTLIAHEVDAKDCSLIPYLSFFYFAKQLTSERVIDMKSTA